MRAIPRIALNIFLGAFALLFAIVSAEAGELRTLTDKTGRSIRAEVMSLEGDRLTIRRDDGQEFTMALSSLSEADQKAVKAWIQETKPLGAKVTFVCNRRIYPAKKDDVDVTNEFGAVMKAAATRVREMAGYDIVVKNHSATPVKMLVVKYVVYAKPVGETTARVSANGLVRQSEAYHGSLTAGQTLTIPAMIAVETKVKMKPKFGAANQTLEQSVSTLHGIWVRVYTDGGFVGEFSLPSSVSATEEWPLG